MKHYIHGLNVSWKRYDLVLSYSCCLHYIFTIVTVHHHIELILDRFCLPPAAWPVIHKRRIICRRYSSAPYRPPFPLLPPPPPAPLHPPGFAASVVSVCQRSTDVCCGHRPAADSARTRPCHCDTRPQSRTSPPARRTARRSRRACCEAWPWPRRWEREKGGEESDEARIVPGAS